MLHDVASGLHHLHSLNRVHCDLKPNKVNVPTRPCLHLFMSLHALSALLRCVPQCSPWAGTIWATGHIYLPVRGARHHSTLPQTGKYICPGGAS